MKVLYISKASIIPAYRDKLHALAEHVDLAAVIPERWGDRHAGPLDDATRDDHAGACDTAPAAGGMHPAVAGRARIRTARALLHGHNHFHVYSGAAALVHDAAPDLVHIDEEPYSAVTFQLARICHAAGVPCVFFAWQNLHKRLPPPFGLVRRHVFARAAAAIAGTNAAADVLRRAGWMGRTAVIPQIGVSPARFRPDAGLRATVRARLGIAPDGFVAGCAARLVPGKGVDLLLDAAAPLADTHVLIIGDGAERSRLSARVRSLGIAARTQFSGAVESVDMPAWLNALDVLVLPSRRSRGWAEQFGRVLIEAMACGVPVVGAVSGEIPDVIASAGLTFPENDAGALSAAIRQLRDAPGLRRTFGELGRARALEHFTHGRIATDTAALYQQVLHGTGVEDRRDVAEGVAGSHRREHAEVRG